MQDLRLAFSISEKSAELINCTRVNFAFLSFHTHMIHNELLQDSEAKILPKMLSVLLWVTGLVVHELHSKGLLYAMFCIV